MTPVYHLQPNACIRNWLMRVDAQYDEATPKKVKEADYDRAKKSLGLGNTTNNYFFSSPRPTYGGLNIGNTRTIYNTYNITNVDNTPIDSSNENLKESPKKKKAEEEKTNWKAVAAIGIVSTAVAGISIFVYARLSKAAEGALNYLENTTRVKNWSETIAMNPGSDSRIAQIAQIAQAQLKIDQRAVDKITNYKYSILTSLVGTLAMAGGGITILASAPVLAAAGTTAIVAGGVLNSIAVMYAAYNCGMHWSDQEEGKKEFNEVKSLIPNLITAFNPSTQPQNHISQSEDNRSQETPPSYDESQFIYNQRVNPKNIYPDLLGFKFELAAPSAPPAYDLI